MTRSTPILFSLLFLLSACEIPISSSSESTQTYAIQIDKSAYEATIDDANARTIKVDIQATFTNITSAPVYLIGCGPPHTSALDLLENQEWVNVYSPVNNLCLSPPEMISPGKTIDLPSEIFACFPGNNCGPEFKGPDQGIYRLRQYWIYYDSEGKKHLEEELLISNSFSLTVKR